MNYCHLDVHSWYSLLEGVDPPEVLLRHAAESGYRALALTDTNALYGAVVFRDAATRCGMRPIFGATLEAGGRRCVALVANRTGYENLCRLITAIQLQMIEDRGSRKENRVPARRETVAQARDPRSSILDPPSSSSLARLIPPLADSLHLLTSDLELAESLCRALGPQRVWLELVRPGPREHEWRLWRLHERLGIQIVASTNVHFATPAGFERHRLVTAIRENTLLERIADHSLAHPHHALHAPQVIEQLFADLPAAVENAAWLAERCDSDVLPRGPFVPQARVPQGMTAEQYLWELCRQGLEQSYENRGSRIEDRESNSCAILDSRSSILNPQSSMSAARERLEREMNIITARHLADYFLVVREIVMFSRERGLPVALRGSGGNCLVAYLIGITDVDPLEYGLPMERFLHEGREDLPDLDIDFCWRVRDRVIEHVFERFGPRHTAMISSHITLQARSAFREVAKVHGLSEAEVSRLVEGLPERVEELMEEERTEDRGWRIEDRGLENHAVLHPRSSILDLLFAQARSLVGAPHYLSVHPGGVVITPRPIDHYVPLQRAEKGILITQFEKDAAEAVGLVKFDLLGNRSLSTVAEGMRRVEDRGSRVVDQIPFDLSTFHPRSSILDPPSSILSGGTYTSTLTSYRVPPDDATTARMLRRGDTIGVGQLESPAMRHLLIMLEPRSQYDVMQSLALIRPGASSIGCKELFVERRRGMKPIEFAHPCLEPVMRETYGLMLYEDDAMHVVAAMTGLPLGEADRFRKGITKCKTDVERERWSREFLRRAVQHGVPIEAAKEQWVHIAKFNAYSFCKSHAASYAQLAWASAYLKAHHPLQFWVAALNNNQGMYEKRVYIEEAKRSGIRVLLPCVNRSEEEFGIEDGGWKIEDRGWNSVASGEDRVRTRSSTLHPLSSSPVGAIRIGLDQIAGLNEKTRERISNERERRLYRSLEDLLARVPIGPEAAVLLIRAGALDFTGRPRPQLLLQAAVSRSFDPRSSILDPPSCSNLGSTPLTQRAMFEPAPIEMPPLPDYSPAQRLRDEFELLRISVGPHLMVMFRPLLPRRLVDSRVLRRSIGRRVALAGIVATARHAPTKNGDTMQFVTLEDEYGVFEVTLFPDLCSRLPYLRLGPYVVEGDVENQYGVVTVTARRFELFETSVGVEAATVETYEQSKNVRNATRKGIRL